MPSPLFSTWVKNVYSLRIVGGISRAQSYTAGLRGVVVRILAVYKELDFHTILPTFYTWFSTLTKPSLPPLKVVYAHNPQGLLLIERRKYKKGITIWS